MSPNQNPAREGRLREGTPEMERERFSETRSYAAYPGGLGHRPVRRLTGLRGARCTGAGEGPPVCTRRFQEARPRPSRRVKPSAHDRGGAPQGEGADALASAPCGREKRWCSPRPQQGFRPSAAERTPMDALSALRLPFLLEGEVGRAFLSWRGQTSDAKAHRENEETCIRPRDSGGGGPPEGWWRGRGR